MKKEYEYKIEKQDDGKFLVIFNDEFESATEGDTLEEAIENAEEVKKLLQQEA
jgi:predicted RNase H-like HicB family nuclease